jgi:hypothetical protein
MTDFEDPTQLARCIKSDCQAYRAGGTPFCAQHLREQEVASAGIAEPEVEELARAAGDAAMAETYFGSDIDAVEPIAYDHDALAKALELRFATTGKGGYVHFKNKEEEDAWVAQNNPTKPDPAEFEPHWDAQRREWILRPKPADPFRGYPQKMARITSLVRELMAECDIAEEDHG